MSFILRKVTDDSEANICLGENYNVINRLLDPETFNRTLDRWTGGVINPDTENIYIFLVCDDDSKVIPLYRTQRNYVMVSNGSTFANLSC